MAAIYASASATASDSSSRSLRTLVVGLTALASGVGMLLVSVELPALPSRPVAIIAAAANRMDPAPVVNPQDVARAPGSPRLLTASNGPSFVVRSAGATMTDDNLAAGQISAVRLDPDIRAGSPRPSPCLEIDHEQGTRAEPAPVVTIPLRRDPREVLITLAAMQHGGPGIWSGPCLMRRLIVQDPGQAASDARITNALVALAPPAAPQRTTGPS